MSRLFDALQNAGHDVTGKFENKAEVSASVSHAVKDGLPSDIADQRYFALFKKLRSLDVNDGGQLVALMGPNGGEGTSTIAKELAGFISRQTDDRILLLHCLAQSQITANKVQPVAPLENLEAIRLSVTSLLPSGRQAQSYISATIDESFVERCQPGEQDELSRFFESLKSDFDWILLDCPPVLRSGRTNRLARHADSNILVVESERSEISKVVEASERLSMVDASVLGIILNKRTNFVPSRLQRLLSKFGVK